ncbi:MAG: glycine cleavage system aminomethyltransferase GcvT, partial [Anaerolineales bacterium]|nr:glycine cleavage system aminomethyltransferase GcvT [Anaerolineales bacterium]
DLLLACRPYRDRTQSSLSQRAKVDFDALWDAKLRVRALAEGAGIDFKPSKHGYPHFYYPDDKPPGKAAWVGLEASGSQAQALLNVAIASDIEAAGAKSNLPAQMHTPKGAVQLGVSRLGAGHYLLAVPRAKFGLAAEWLRALSDGYVTLDAEDLARTAPGPVAATESKRKVAAPKGKPAAARKPYAIGTGAAGKAALPDFAWQPPADPPLKRTRLYEVHQSLGAKLVPFAGWDMPLRYSSVREEHLAVRQAAGLFDVSHMGVYDARGPQAAAFLDSVCANDIAGLHVGMSLYTHFLDPDGGVIDDLLVYRLDEEDYLVVVNASNNEKNWAWLNAVRAGEVCIDRQRPDALAFGRGAELRDLRAASSGADQRVDLALQGPNSRKILLALADKAGKARLRGLGRFGVTRATVAGLDLIVSRTGYTGEWFSYELFIHPDQAVQLWHSLFEAGAKHGLQPIGLGARDSLRIEAGLPLYGQELAGPHDLSPADAGFRGFVRTGKPWFIGRDAFLAREAKRRREVLRFQFPPGVRMAHQGDPVTDADGKAIGEVTSCSLDQHGTLTGQAWVDKKHAKEGTAIFVYQGMHGKQLAADAQGTEARVLSRF